MNVECDRSSIFNNLQFYIFYLKFYVMFFLTRNFVKSFYVTDHYSPNSWYILCKNVLYAGIHCKYVSCWKCKFDNKDKLFCEKCKVIQEPKDKHYYDLLGISCTYDVDVTELTSKYHRMQSVLHPDKFTNKSEKERKISEEYSSLVNKAYSTLVTPLKRGIYFLKLNGGSIKDGYPQDNIFLLEIMELNEELEEVENADQLKKLNKRIEDTIKLFLQNLSVSFKNQNIQEAEKWLTKIVYYNSILKKIKEKL